MSPAALVPGGRDDVGSVRRRSAATVDRSCAWIACFGCWRAGGCRIGFVIDRRRSLAGASDAIVARDRRDARRVRRSAADLGGRASREEPRGHDVGPLSLRAASALCRARASWASASPSPPTALVVAVLVLGYLAITLTAAIRTEEAHLTEKFGNDYPDYRNGKVSDGATIQRRARDEEPGVSRARPDFSPSSPSSRGRRR